MKKVFYSLIFIFLFLFSVSDVHAYAVIKNTYQDDKPHKVTYEQIRNWNYYDTTTYIDLGTSPWLYSIDDWSYVGNISGDILSVQADYYVRIGIAYDQGLKFYNYMDGTRNTLTANNLRCSASGLRTGYDSTHLPEVTNFSVSYSMGQSDIENILLIHITFNYLQQLSKTSNGGNMSCWFERNPSDGLFVQISGATAGYVTSYYHYNKYTYNLYTDETIAKLDELNTTIQEESQKIVDKLMEQTNKVTEQIVEIQETNAKLDELNESVSSESDDPMNKSCGMICKLKNIFNVLNPFSEDFFAYKLVDLLLDMLKSLFIPTEEHLEDIIDKSSSLAENFGFVGQSMDFFINTFTGLLTFGNGDSCMDMPEMSIGKSSLFDSFTLWDETHICLSENDLLSDNIDLIRTFTSVVLVGLFVGFASRQFFGILSKNGSGTDVTYDSSKNTTYVTSWEMRNGDMTSNRRSVKW